MKVGFHITPNPPPNPTHPFFHSFKTTTTTATTTTTTTGSWFVITPRYKYRSEGEPVMMGDEIVLVSKHFNNYLHCSKPTFSDKRHEINGSNRYFFFFFFFFFFNSDICHINPFFFFLKL